MNETNKRKQHKKLSLIQMKTLSTRTILIRNPTPLIFYTTLNTLPSPLQLSNPPVASSQYHHQQDFNQHSISIPTAISASEAAFPR